jgi:hypothetical protein
MPNEMRRACVIPSVNDGKPFEAWGAREVPSNGLGVCLTTGRYQITFIPVDSAEELEATRASITFQLAQALNPLIEVTQAVLDAMEKVPEARFSMYVKYHTHRREIGKRYPLQYDEHYKVFHAFGVQGVQQLQIGDYIQASDGCPLALQVLLQFNEEGELFNV